MPKACELKNGDAVSINGAPSIFESLKVSTPSARGASSIYQLRFRNLITKAKIDHRVKGEEPYSRIDFERRHIQYLYHEQDVYTFMDMEDFSQFELMKEYIESDEVLRIDTRTGKFISRV